MTLPAHDYTVYHLPLYPAQDSHATTRYRSNRQAKLHVSSIETRDSVVAIVNVVWDLNLHTLLRGLSNVITPLSSVFSDAFNPTVTRHLLHTATYTFIWMPARAFSPSCASAASPYAVVFTLSSERRYLSLALSFLLLRFSETYTRLNDYNRFKLVNLAYKFTEDSVYGVLFYDRNISTAFRATHAKASSLADEDHCLWQGHAVCIWNGGDDVLPNDSILSHCEEYCEQARSIL